MLISSIDISYNQKVNAVFKGIADKKGSHLTLLMRLLGELGTEKDRMLHYPDSSAFTKFFDVDL
jgi:hypothetical protein